MIHFLIGCVVESILLSINIHTVSVNSSLIFCSLDKTIIYGTKCLLFSSVLGDLVMTSKVSHECIFILCSSVANSVSLVF